MFFRLPDVHKEGVLPYPRRMGHLTAVKVQIGAA